MPGPVCRFPYTGASCEVTIGMELGSIYWGYVILYSALTVIVAIPTLSSVIRRCNRQGTVSIPSLDRPDAMLLRVAFALVAFLVQIPDPLGFYAILSPIVIELSSAVSSLVLLSIVISLIFRPIRTLLLLSDRGLSQIGAITRLYSATQYVAIAVWLALPLCQVLVGPDLARYFKAIALLWTLIVVVIAYGSAALAACLIVRAMFDHDTGILSAVTSQTRYRARKTMRSVLISAVAVLVVFVPITLYQVVLIMSRPIYPDPSFVPDSFLALILLSSFHLMKLLLASAVSIFAMYSLTAPYRDSRSQISFNSAVFTMELPKLASSNPEAGFDINNNNKQAKSHTFKSIDYDHR